MIFSSRATLSNRILQLNNKDDYIKVTITKLVEKTLNGFMSYYKDHIVSTVNRETLELDLSLDLFVYTRDELEEYIKYRVKKDTENLL